METIGKPIRLVSVNIKGGKFMDRLEPFLRDRQPDVVCLQEARESAISLLRDLLGAEASYFVPTSRYPSVALGDEREGLAILSMLPLLAPPEHRYYVWNGEEAPPAENGPWNGYNRALAWVTLEHEGLRYRFGTIHHTWTPDGDVNDAQRRDTDALLVELGKLPHIVLCGDSNAARMLKSGLPGETFHRFAERYQDNIPADVISTIDPKLHESAPLDLVVDVLFSTPDYDIRSVEVVSGVSDHRAIVADVLRVADR